MHSMRQTNVKTSVYCEPVTALPFAPDWCGCRSHASPHRQSKRKSARMKAIAGVIRDDTVVKSSGWFGGGSERSEDECDAIKGTMLLALGYCTTFAPLETLSSRVEAHVASHFQAALEKLPLNKIDLRDCLLRGLIEISCAIGKKGSNLQLSMRDYFLSTISTWVSELLSKKKVDIEPSSATCSLVLEACAGLVAVVPKPENTVIANILSNVLIIVQSSFEDDKTDVIQPLSMFFQACGGFWD